MLFTRRFRGNKTNRSRPANLRQRTGYGRRLRIEGLEDRRMLSATSAPELLKDINGLSAFPSSPQLLAVFNDELFFNAFGAYGYG